MGDDVITNCGAVRYHTIIQRTEQPTAEEKAYMMKEVEADLDTALQMPMFKKLPAGGLKYGWKQFHLQNGGLFIVQPSRVGHHFQIFNDHVKNFTPQEMDIFCAEVFRKAYVRLAGFKNFEYVEKWIDVWTEVPHEVGIKVLPKSAANSMFWDWAMKLVAARLLWLQDNSLDERSAEAPGVVDDTIMLEQPTKNVPDPTQHSLTAQAIDRFLVFGQLVIGRFAQRKPGFGSHLGLGGPHWLAFTFRVTSQKEIHDPRLVLSEPQNKVESAEGSNSKAGVVDDLVIGMHSTTIAEGRTARPIFPNLAIRTSKPLKRSHDDIQESEATEAGDEPLAKMAKTSQGQTNTSGSRSQLAKP